MQYRKTLATSKHEDEITESLNNVLKDLSQLVDTRTEVVKKSSFVESYKWLLIGLVMVLVTAGVVIFLQ